MGIEPTLSAWKAEVLPLNYTRPSSFVYRQPPVQPKVPNPPDSCPVPASHVVEGGGFEPPKAEPTDLQSAPFDRSGTPPRLSNDQFSLFLPGSSRFFSENSWPLADFPQPGARRGIRTPDLLILTRYCFHSRQALAFGVWTFSSPYRDYQALG